MFCGLLRDMYPPAAPGLYCNDEGIEVLRRIAAWLESSSG